MTERNLQPLAELFERFISLLFPPRCVLCEDVVSYDTLWCGCEIKKHPQGYCPICYQKETSCHCPVHSFLWVRSPFSYEGGTKSAVLTLKRKKDKRTIRFLSRAMIPLVEDDIINHNVVGVVSVPIKDSALDEKKFNHADLLAEELSAMLGLSFYPNALWREEHSLAQKNLNWKQRQENATAAYHKNKNFHLPEGSILLVDDVCTTGATLEACSRKLLALGAKKVLAVTATCSTIENHR